LLLLVARLQLLERLQLLAVAPSPGALQQQQQQQWRQQLYQQPQVQQCPALQVQRPLQQW
jgi:hypothetical protein